MFNHNRHTLVRWFTLSMGSILVAFAAGIYSLEVHRELRDIDKILYASTKLLAASVRYQEQNGHWNVQLRNVPLLGTRYVLLHSSGVSYARWYDTDGKLLQFVGSPPPTKLADRPRYPRIATQKSKSSTVDPWIRQITLPLYAENHIIGYLQAGISLTSSRTTLDEFRMILAIAVPLVIVVIAAASWVLSGIAMQPAQRSYQRMEQFTADAAHELRAPVAAILSNAQLGLLSDEATQSVQRLQNVVGLARDMSALVSHLLILARSQHLALDTLTTIDLGWLFEDLLDEYQEMFGANALLLIARVPEYPILVKANPDLLRQAIANLLTNACKYTLDGGSIEAHLETTGNSAILQIKDTGIGIPRADLPYIFERFYRVDKERSRQTGGLGLGLAIAQQIVLSHGGKIRATSVLGEGSVFQIILPLTDASRQK
ncbi:MAG TPA: HAMP domain-containing sensor histidine kinase [Chroococcidiopsis sp.]